MRVTTVILSIILAIICSAMAVYYNNNAYSHQQELNVETYKRMVTEESLQKANVKISVLDSELIRYKNKLKKTEMLLEQNEIKYDDLKSRLNKVSKINEDLKTKVKELQTLSEKFNVTEPPGETQ